MSGHGKVPPRLPKCARYVLFFFLFIISSGFGNYVEILFFFSNCSISVPRFLAIFHLIYDFNELESNINRVTG